MKTILRFLLVTALALTGFSPSHAQWVQTNGPTGGGYVTSFAISGTNLFAGLALNSTTAVGGVFRSTDGGATWTAVNTGLPADISVLSLAVSGTTLFAGTDYGRGVYRSTDGGANWTIVGTGFGAQSVSSFAVIGANVFAATQGNGVFLSTDNGTTWTAVNSGLNGLGSTYVYALAASGTTLFAGTSGNGVYRSTDSGGSWTSVNAGLGDPVAGFPFVCSLAVSGAEVFAGTLYGQIYHSTNSGATWTAANSGIPSNNPVYALATRGTNLFAGIDGLGPANGPGGVFCSTNNGANWTRVSNGLTNNHVRTIVVSGDNVLAGTSGGGVWKRPVSELLSIESATRQLPKRLSLEQNYPNPFNPSTTIRYSLLHRSHVTLTVYNTLGQKVADLVNSEIDAGYHEVQFNAGNLASGVCFYCLQAGSYTETRKLIVMK